MKKDGAKRLIIAAGVTAVLMAAIAVAMAFLLTDTGRLTRRQYFGALLELKAFNRGLKLLDEDGMKTLYQIRCATKCHGAGPIETSRHTSREWKSIIKRMRDNGAPVTPKEGDAIVGYLQKNYGSNVPTILSRSANRFLKHHLWKSDFGEEDLYVDVIYATKEYFDLMGGLQEARRLEPGKLVFMVYLNTHQEKLKPWDLRTLAMLKGPAGAQIKASDWEVTYESGDKHHIEGVLRFETPLPEDVPFMEITVSGLPGRERSFRWDLPIPVYEGEKDEAP